MREFSWKYFTMTGDVDAYLLYRQIAKRHMEEPEWDEDENEAQAEEIRDEWLH